MNYRRANQTHHRARGYCLAVTVVLLAVAGLTLVATSRRTVERGLLAERQSRALQARWGVLSVSDCLKSRAATLLDRAEERSRKRLSSANFSVTLGEQKFSIEISDEQSKVDINAVSLRNQNLSDTAVQLRHLLGGQELSHRILLRPEGGPSSIPFPSFGHLFQDPQPTELFASPEQPGQVPPAALISCAGTGKLNIARAPKPVIQAWFEPLIGSAATGRLLATGQPPNAVTLTAVADGLMLGDEAREKFLNSAALDSNRFSIRVTSGPTTRLLIVDRSGALDTTVEWP